MRALESDSSRLMARSPVPRRGGGARWRLGFQFRVNERAAFSYLEQCVSPDPVWDSAHAVPFRRVSLRRVDRNDDKPQTRAAASAGYTPECRHARWSRRKRNDRLVFPADDAADAYSFVKSGQSWVIPPRGKLQCLQRYYRRQCLDTFCSS